MSFAGHETFHIREGWLSRSLKLVICTPEIFEGEFPEDELGVGRNMYKSIRFWLIATGLVDGKLVRKGAEKSLQATWLGNLLWEYDPYFLNPTTWWILHVNLVNNPGKSVVWNWFFNSWNLQRFEKSRCLNLFTEYVDTSFTKMPKQTTLEKDLNVFLNSYAVKTQTSERDPESTSECPLQELGLMKYHMSSNTYETSTGGTSYSSALLGYSMWRSDNHTASDGCDLSGSAQKSVTEWVKEKGGPGSCFLLNEDNLFECIQRQDDDCVEIKGLAGDRKLRLQERSGSDWVKDVYLKQGEAVTNV